MQFIPEYILGRQNNKIMYPKNRYFDEVTKETYGIMIYQEQVMILSQEMAGFSMADADILRKAIGGKNIEMLNEQREKFVKGALKEHGVSEVESNEIFDLIMKFASYGFNRAHSAAYAYIAYMTAFLKANYRAEFTASALSVSSDNSVKLGIVLSETQRKAPINNMNLIPPKVGVSTANFTVKETSPGTKDIVYGYHGIKGVSLELGQALEGLNSKNNGQISTLQEVFSGIPKRLLSSTAVQNLFYSGAFDKYSNSRQGLINVFRNQLVDWVKYNESSQEFAHYLDEPIIEVEESVEMELFEKLSKEKAVGHVYFSEHPLNSLQGKTVKELLEFNIGQPSLLSGEDANAYPTTLGELKSDLFEIIDNNRLHSGDVDEEISAWILAFNEDSHTISTKNGDTMMFMRLEDISSEITTLTLFPDLLDIMSTPQGTSGAMLDKITSTPLLLKVKAKQDYKDKEDMSLTLDLGFHEKSLSDINKVFHKLSIQTLGHRYYVLEDDMSEDVVEKLNNSEGLDELVVVNPNTGEVYPFKRKVSLSKDLKKLLNI